MATKIGIFNAALVELGHRRLSDTGEAVEAGRELVAVHSDVVLECLSAGSWNFATETVMADADTGVTPEFGYPEVFAKPSDWLRTVSISTDENFCAPLLDYYDDSTYWSAESTPIYIRYVSSDTGMGLDLTRWTPVFARYVALEHADRVCMALTQNAGMKEAIGKLRDKARRRALNLDAMNEPNPKFPPPNSWTLARGSVANRNRATRGNLVE